MKDLGYTIGFACEGFCIDVDRGLEGTILKGLSDIIGYIEDFFSKAGAGVWTGTATGVFGVVEIAGVLEIADAVVGVVEIGAASDAGLEASSCARHGKTVSWSKCLTKLLKGQTANRMIKKKSKRSSAIASLARS